MRKISVDLDETDLAVVRAVAARTGRSESDIIREALRRAVLSLPSWGEPVVTETFDFGGQDHYGKEAVRAAVVAAVQRTIER